MNTILYTMYIRYIKKICNTYLYILNMRIDIQLLIFISSYTIFHLSV
jgi:hypothetical protein